MWKPIVKGVKYRAVIYSCNQLQNKMSCSQYCYLSNNLYRLVSYLINKIVFYANNQ